MEIYFLETQKQITELDIDRNEMTEKDLSRITILQKVNCNLINKNVGKASRIKQLSMINIWLMPGCSFRI